MLLQSPVILFAFFSKYAYFNHRNIIPYRYITYTP